MPRQVDNLLQMPEKPGPAAYLLGTSCRSSARDRDDGARFCLSNSRGVGKDFGNKGAVVNECKRGLCHSAGDSQRGRLWAGQGLCGRTLPSAADPAPQH